VKAGTLKEEGVLQKIDHAEKLPMVRGYQILMRWQLHLGNLYN